MGHDGSNEEVQMINLVKVGLVGLLLALVLVMTNGCGDGSNAVKSAIPPSNKNSTQVRVQAIGYGTALKAYSYNETGYGTILPSNADGNGYIALIGKNVAPCLGDTTNRGGSSNNTIVYQVCDANGVYLEKQPVVANMGRTIFRFTEAGKYIVKAFFDYNGQDGVELSCWLQVNEDPNRANLTVASTATNVVNEASSRLVRVQVSNGKIGTVAHNVRIYATFGASSVTGNATADEYILSNYSAVSFTTSPVLVPGTLRIVSVTRGGPGGETEEDPSDMSKGILVGDIIGGEYKAITFKVSLDPNFVPGEVKLYWMDGTELEKLPDGSYFIRERSETARIKEVAVGYGKEPVYMCLKVPGATTYSGSILAHEGTSWYKWDGQYEFWLSNSSTGFPQGKVTHLTVGAK